MNFLFTNSSTELCLKAGDVDDSGLLELTDAVALFTFLFLGGPPPADPHLFCGPDLTSDDLDCDISLCPSAAADEFPQFFVVRNGTECPSPPCFEWTARTLESGPSEEIPISAVLFDYVVNLTVSSETVKASLAGQRRLRGPLQDGPQHPRGEGKTLVPVQVLPDASPTFPVSEPDLFISSVGFSTPFDIDIDRPFTPPVQTTILPVSVTVENLGSTASGSFDVELRFQGDVVKTWTVSDGLLAGKQVILGESLSFPLGGVPDTFVLVADVDPENGVVEVLESNNRRTKLGLPAVNVPGPPQGPVVGG